MKQNLSKFSTLLVIGVLLASSFLILLPEIKQASATVVASHSVWFDNHQGWSNFAAQQDFVVKLDVEITGLQTYAENGNATYVYLTNNTIFRNQIQWYCYSDAVGFYVLDDMNQPINGQLQIYYTPIHLGSNITMEFIHDGNLTVWNDNVEVTSQNVTGPVGYDGGFDTIDFEMNGGGGNITAVVTTTAGAVLYTRTDTPYWISANYGYFGQADKDFTLSFNVQTSDFHTLSDADKNCYFSLQSYDYSNRLTVYLFSDFVTLALQDNYVDIIPYGCNIATPISTGSNITISFKHDGYLVLYNGAAQIFSALVTGGDGYTSGFGNYQWSLNQPTYDSGTGYVSFTYSVAQVSDWLMFKHDPTHSGLNTGSAIYYPTKLWNYSTGDAVRSSPAVADGVVYFGSNDQYFYALNASTGSQLWNYSAGDVIGASPSIVNDIAYFASHNVVFALNATTGAYIWSSTTGAYTEYYSLASPTVADNVVYYGFSNGVGAGELDALDAFSGTQLWYYPIAGHISTTPTVANNVVYFAGGTGMMALDTKNNGALIWIQPSYSGSLSAITYDSGTLYFADGSSGYTYAVNATDGAQYWSHANSGYASPTVANGKVYLSFDGSDTVSALNATTGAVLWSLVCGYSDVVSSPAVVDGIVYFGSLLGNCLFAVNASSGAELGNFTTGGNIWSSPAVVNGVAYIGSDDGNMYAIENGSPPPPPPIPGGINPSTTPTPTPTPAPSFTIFPQETVSPAPPPWDPKSKDYTTLLVILFAVAIVVVCMVALTRRRR